MKLAHVVAKFIEQQGVKHVFGVSGGASLHLIHAFHETTQVNFIPTAHEAGAGFAADAYARLRGLGVAVATSGPGATNLVTSIAAAYYDSVPLLAITGNCATFRFGIPLGVRQYGFQEGPIVDMVRPITKYAVTVTQPQFMRYELEKALWYAKEGRKGPVLIDIPDDMQRADVEQTGAFLGGVDVDESPDVSGVVTALQGARRPVFVWGAGVRAHALAARALAHHTGIPVACTWGAIDLLPSSDPLMLGGFGTHGNRAPNFAVQNADLIVSLGSRLDTKATAHPPTFARGAKVVMVDIDDAEIRKFEKLGRRIDIGLHADCGDVIEALMGEDIVEDRAAWQMQCMKWKASYRPKDDPAWSGTKPYALMRKLAEYTTPEDVIVSDTGTALGYIMQGFPFNGERFLHAFNATPMGYGIPAAVGAAAASGKRVVLVTGDGSALMAIQELATIARHNLDIKIILLNNNGHRMCVRTEEQWFKGVNCATTPESGLGFPAWRAAAHAFHIDSWSDLASIFEQPGPQFMEVKIDEAANLAQQGRFGAPLEDQEPMLGDAEHHKNMIVPSIREKNEPSARAATPV